MSTVFMTDRLMRAADALLQHGAVIEVNYVGPGVRRRCLLVGRGERAGLVRLAVWTALNEIKEGRHGVKFTDCLLPAETVELLEKTARVQDRESGTTDCTEYARALAFTARARQQRRRNGQFADGTHRAEAKGVR